MGVTTEVFVCCTGFVAPRFVIDDLDMIDSELHSRANSKKLKELSQVKNM